MINAKQFTIEFSKFSHSGEYAKAFTKYFHVKMFDALEKIAKVLMQLLFLISS